ncbi:Ku protein [Mesorhizobium sp. M2D.F.Ca.ET.185.01.1.1]|uniref:non-homologous end joining protein Ku n=2 Tax=Mesorhizobium TaxID=68287 RepID=UPI000FC9A778|nr:MULTISPECIES: Ku protein [unclassified Mesorhizobium]TGP73351.1 Ku protein [bacterium M00.F.Ca.ET.227.01.1.1]TGP84344.1 Ku protein [bacterium M00.F.Ca.ET.221.01.1.1]TGP86978.1 Ku protein [bacterium M00.F.Ca.ET.222.01.1.1]TGU01796.1 Ku protein [bacterium M00.F.Ca.ET.163.01.1.1]TGU19131.1 Ku protein [bacterium M00.F.Ca.ET.156.01.1.1]TGU43129.1 Ku protein [bacterium M00.F.Ca.ET.146.01.1.1]TGV65797.1 Ku protein [Mesorhizobium sp. M2D.F.Ca.ET.160.01.1.1]TGW08735.1 Ku protein [Mesorhizobium sp
MAPRPAWKGYLKLSLVTCAIELTNVVTHAEKVSFRILNRKTGNTVKRIYVDAETGKPLEEGDEIKGYEVSDGDFVHIEEEEIEAVQIESSHTMSLDGFVEKSSIEQIYLDTPYYVSPADKVSEEAFAVIRDAMAARKMAGLARIVLYQRERPVVIEPLGKGMVLTTLRYDDTVRRPATVFEDITAAKTDKEMIDLAQHIIDGKKTKFDPSKFEDRYEDALLELIRAKKAGKKAPKAKAPPKPSNVVNLFDALKKSLNAEGGAKSGKSSWQATTGKSKSKPAPKRKSA